MLVDCRFQCCVPRPGGHYVIYVSVFPIMIIAIGRWVRNGQMTALV